MSTATEAKRLTVEVSHDGIATVTMSRPPANALDRLFMEELRAAAERFSMDSEVRVVVLRSGVPGFFMAGADLAMLDGGWDRMLTTIRGFHDAGNAWERIPVPTIAAIDGLALGAGCELALACDLRILSDRSGIGCPEVKIGLIASGGGTQRLPRLIGRGPAMDLMLRGRMARADEAARLGLATEVVVQDALESRVAALAQEIAALPTLAVRETKRCIVAGLDGSLLNGLQLEERANTFLATTEDAREGVGAFVQKRAPHFVGR